MTEVDPSGNLDPAHVWGSPTYAGLTSGLVNVPPGGTATVTVTNHTEAVFGTLSVTKELTGATEGVRAGATFPITVACDNPAKGGAGDYSETFDLTVNATVTTPELPVGTGCTVTEGTLPALALVDDSYAWGPHPAAQNVTVDTANQTTAVTVTNQVVRAYGSLSVTKTITPLNGVTGAGTTFTGTWSCTTGDETKSGTWSRTGAGPATLTGGADQILLTSTCSVTENDPTTSPNPGDPSYAWGAKTVGVPVTLTAAAPNGTLTGGQRGGPHHRAPSRSPRASKVASPAPRSSTGCFTFTWDCAGTTGTVDGAGGSDQPGEREHPDRHGLHHRRRPGRPAPITPYDWDDVTITPTTFTISSTTPVAVQRHQHDQPAHGHGHAAQDRRRPRRRVHGRPGLPWSAWSACSTATPPPTVPSRSRRTARSASPASWSARPAPRSRHRSTPGTDSRTRRTPGDRRRSPREQTLTSLAVTYDFTVINHVERVYGPLALEKLLEDPDHVVAPTRTYSGTWTCTRTGDPAVSGTWTVSGRRAGDPDRGAGPGDPARLHLHADRGGPGRAALGDRPLLLLGRPRPRVGHHQRRRHRI